MRERARLDRGNELHDTCGTTNRTGAETLTWSIVARDRTSGTLGIAAASRFFALGALVPWARQNAGAIATQAMINPMLGPAGLELLEEGLDAEAALRQLIANDAGSAARQVHLVDGAGRTAAFTGGECIDWCGHLTEDGVSVAGNMLAGPQVVEETMRTYITRPDLIFAERLLNALLAGDAAGGDKRGKQSAVLLVQGAESYPDYDLRVDDHPEAPAELRRLYEVAQGDFAIYRQFLPTRANPAGITDREKLAAARAAANAPGAGT
jgi:uncharacterized Ntn-hydrolase superfamily protein